MNKLSALFHRRGSVMVLAAFCALSWASAFPAIKIGLKEFQIAGDDIWAKTLFAGIRFFLAGLVVLLLAKLMGKRLKLQTKSDGALLLLFGLVNTALNYFCFYMGLSALDGSRSAILNSMGTFLLILFSCMLFRDDRMTPNKAIGCLLGFGGIVLINTGGGDLWQELSLMGDGMMLLSSLSAAFGGILTRIVTRRTDPIVATGISLSFGGGLLMLAGFLLGGRIPAFTWFGLLILLLLIGISSASFTIYNQLLCCNPVSSIAIFNALIPILGVVLCCVFLGEAFSLKYLLAGAIVAAGVTILNRDSP